MIVKLAFDFTSLLKFEAQKVFAWNLAQPTPILLLNPQFIPVSLYGNPKAVFLVMIEE